jgi:linoleoyl-CoA desaturase
LRISKTFNTIFIKTITFSNPNKSDFSATLRKRVAEHFKSRKKSKHANASMLLKTGVMLSLFLVPIAVVVFVDFQSIPLLFALYILSGFGMAGIGMGIMHDAIHGSYSKNPRVNKFLGLTLNLIGANANLWRIQHNVLHHSYTNIQHADDDINTPPFLRFSPNVPKRPIHAYQHIYTWFFYSLSTLSWITSKDFVRVKRYRDFGIIRTQKEYQSKLWNIILWKTFYYTYILIIPMIVSGFPIWILFLAFISMHLITGTCISLVFQIAHVMPDVEYPLPDSAGNIESERLVHQMVTTSNFSPKSRIFSWLIGGLNYQVEHHLFPNICHVHYREISPIVRKTAAEFGVPYITEASFASAIYTHMKMLRYLGRDAA